MSHAQIGCREGIDSQLLVVGSQTALDLGCRCPNCQCEDIFDIFVSRPFQRHQEHPNARCFAPCCRALNIRESRRTPNPPTFPSVGLHPHTWPKWGCDTYLCKTKWKKTNEKMFFCNIDWPRDLCKRQGSHHTCLLTYMMFSNILYVNVWWIDNTDLLLGRFFLFFYTQSFSKTLLI
jgi:hypothetical protein